MLSRSRRVSIAAQTGVRLKCTMCGISSPAGKARTWFDFGFGFGFGFGLGRVREGEG